MDPGTQEAGAGWRGSRLGREVLGREVLLPVRRAGGVPTVDAYELLDEEQEFGTSCSATFRGEGGNEASA